MGALDEPGTARHDRDRSERRSGLRGSVGRRRPPGIQRQRRGRRGNAVGASIGVGPLSSQAQPPGRGQRGGAGQRERGFPGGGASGEGAEGRGDSSSGVVGVCRVGGVCFLPAPPSPPPPAAAREQAQQRGAQGLQRPLRGDERGAAGQYQGPDVVAAGPGDRRVDGGGRVEQGQSARASLPHARPRRLRGRRRRRRRRARRAGTGRPRRAWGRGLSPGLSKERRAAAVGSSSGSSPADDPRQRRQRDLEDGLGAGRRRARERLGDVGGRLRDQGVRRVSAQTRRACVPTERAQGRSLSRGTDEGGHGVEGEGEGAASEAPAPSPPATSAESPAKQAGRSSLS